jgi:hypothetical protein
VAYYRVSTDRQGASGLGLDAQREAVARFMAGKGELTAQFVEVVSGARRTFVIVLAPVAPDNRFHRRVRLQRGRIYADRLAFDQSALRQPFQHPGEDSLMGFGPDQPPVRDIVT